MNKTSLTRALFAAGAVALAGAAQADAIFYPDGTMVDLGSDNALELSADASLSPATDTTVLGAGAATVTNPQAVPVIEHVYVQPNIDWDRGMVVSQMQHRGAVVSQPTVTERQSAATFDVPARAGEASTMTSGAPNLVTDNDSFVVGSNTIPYSAMTVGQPYYVMSF